MKSFLTNFALFLTLAVVFSGLTGCGSSSGNTAKAPDNTGGNTASANKNSNGDTNLQGAPFPTALAEGEIKKLDATVFKVGDRKGETLLLNLWATWCGPCREEMPELVAMQEKYKDKGFKVIGLNIDGEPEDMIKDFAKEMKLNYELAWIERKTADAYLKYTGFSGIPQTFLVDKNGRLRGVFTGGGKKVIGQMKETVDKIMAE